MFSGTNPPVIGGRDPSRAEVPPSLQGWRSSPSLSPSLPHYLALCLTHPLSHSHSLTLSQCLSHSLTLTLSLSLSHSLTLSPSLCLTLSLTHSPTLLLSHSLCLTHSLTHSRTLALSQAGWRSGASTLTGPSTLTSALSTLTTRMTFTSDRRRRRRASISRRMTSSSRCRSLWVNLEHISQSRLDSGLGLSHFQFESLQHISIVPLSTGDSQHLNFRASRLRHLTVPPRSKTLGCKNTPLRFPPFRRRQVEKGQQFGQKSLTSVICSLL